MTTEGQEVAMKGFDYDDMLQNALRGIVRDTLKLAGSDGLPGAHHFYITFQTDRPDVVMPDYLRQKHQEEITIVLQHQFWDLVVDDHHFAVDLSFNDAREHISVPFIALISFLDPSVKFGLQFIPEAAPMAEKKSSKKGKETKDHKDDGKGDIPPKTGATVVTLDSFRRRK